MLSTLKFGLLSHNSTTDIEGRMQSLWSRERVARPAPSVPTRETSYTTDDSCFNLPAITLLFRGVYVSLRLVRIPDAINP